MAKPTVFDHAVFAHAKWKHHLRQAIETGQSDWTVAEVRADDRCEFGNWLQNLPPLKKRSERFSCLRSLHTEFHAAAAEVLAMALSGKKKEAQTAMAPGSRFSKISAELTLTLSKWSESGGEPGRPR
jgi:hypothetical protein